MPYRTANYTAFCVEDPETKSNLGCNIAGGLRYLNQLKAWKKTDSSFPFKNAHDKTCSVRDDSLPTTLMQRLHQRFRMSKNIILFLDYQTKNTKALREEIDYGINYLSLPVIVVYSDYKYNRDIICAFDSKYNPLEDLWNKIPLFKNSMNKVATTHITFRKGYIAQALNDERFTVQNKTSPGIYLFYDCQYDCQYNDNDE